MRNITIKWTFAGAAFALLSLGTISCSGDGDDKNKDGKDKIDTTANQVDTTKKVAEIDYAVPTPNELFEIISKMDASINTDLVNDVEKSADYVTKKSQALNFGVYTADLAYLSAFGNSAQAMNYFEAIQGLGESLGISAAFDKALVERVEDNKADADSIFMISNDTYFDTYKFLEENDKGPILSMIIVGGWVESMYVITNMVGDYDTNNPLMDDLADQRLVLENILQFLEVYSENGDVQAVTGDLLVLLESFDAMEYIEGNTKVENKNGVITMTGAGHYEMNKEAYKMIKTAIADYRNQITE